MLPAFAKEVVEKAQGRIKDQVFAEATISDYLLRKLGEDVARECGCTISFGPIKTLESANRKVLAPTKDGGYGGDWTELKDAVRITIVAPSAKQMIAVRDKIEQKCRASEGMGIYKNAGVVPTIPSLNPKLPWNDKRRVHDPSLEGWLYSEVSSTIRKNTKEENLKYDPCGYSGLNMVVQLLNERPGEIQVNLGTMIYAKEKERDARAAIGDKLYSDIKQSYRIEGGVGHILYEIYRVAPAGYIGRLAAQASRMYYIYLRNSPNIKQLSKVMESIQEIKKREPSKFRH